MNARGIDTGLFDQISTNHICTLLGQAALIFRRRPDRLTASADASFFSPSIRRQEAIVLQEVLP
jgi:hypothetical protein